MQKCCLQLCNSCYHYLRNIHSLSIFVLYQCSLASFSLYLLYLFSNSSALGCLHRPCDPRWCSSSAWCHISTSDEREKTPQPKMCPVSKTTSGFLPLPWSPDAHAQWLLSLPDLLSQCPVFPAIQHAGIQHIVTIGRTIVA